MTRASDRGFFSTPSTRLGWWSVGLACLFAVMMGFSVLVLWPMPAGTGFVRAALLPAYGIGMVLSALAAGITGAIAVVRQHERSWVVWLLPLLAGVYMLLMLLGEFLVAH